MHLPFSFLKSMVMCKLAGSEFLKYIPFKKDSLISSMFEKFVKTLKIDRINILDLGTVCM